MFHLVITVPVLFQVFINFRKQAAANGVQGAERGVEDKYNLWRCCTHKSTTEDHMDWYRWLVEPSLDFAVGRVESMLLFGKG